MSIQLTPGFMITEGSMPYIIAEIGSNHNGDMNLARTMIDSALKCGCNAVKFQSWTPKSLIAEEEYNRNVKYNDNPRKHWGSLREMVEKYYLRDEQHRELKEYCDTIGIDFCSTPFSPEEADLLTALDVPFYKVASMDINNHRLLKHIASKKKPVILSTGMATLGEIEKAIETITSSGNDKIMLLHCISIYPPEYQDIHLNNIPMLKQTFGYPVGFSDHTIGYSIPLAAVALGACLIEKHFTTDKDLDGWDHEISANPMEMEIIVSESANIKMAMGSHKRVVSNAEREKKNKFRRSIVAARSMKKGDIIREEDLNFKRPGTGIPPDMINYLVGGTLSSDVNFDEVIRWDHLLHS
jgi:sialic acid synthase SpsE